ncbi:MAG TPA: FHA domain-containing protein [Thermomicrobiales bacterium]|nr:FHA domain-containing protein [Thermomicrobiales bacterium]
MIDGVGDLAWLVLLLRVAFVVLLYLFIWQVARICLRDVVEAAGGSARSVEPDRLVILDGGPTPLAPGSWFPLAPGATIGRGGDCAIQLDDPFVSGAHARLERNRNGWRLRDLGSTNGAWVNQKPVRGATTVRAGDVVQCGGVTMLLTAAARGAAGDRAR